MSGIPTAKRLGLLASLYVAQGLPYGFFTQALPVRMREQGVGLGAIGLTALLALPWAFKFLVAPWVDRHGSRRAWIVPLQAGSALTLLAVSFVAPEDSWPLVLGAVFMTNLLAATQDVATDGMAVDLLPAKERGLGNGVQVAGYRAGMVIGGGVLLGVLGSAGWGLAVRLLALALVVSTLPALFAREAARPTVRSSPGVGDLLASLRRPHLAGWLVLLSVYKLGDALASSMVRPLLVDQGHDAAALGRILGGVGFGGGLAGALLGGWLIGQLGRQKALLGFGVLTAASILGYAVLAYTPLNLTAANPSAIPLLYTLVLFEHLASGMATAALFTCMMDACREEHAATDYTLQACVVVIATGFAAALSGFVAEGLGYVGLFVVSSLLTLAGTALVARRGALPEAWRTP
ncbi:MAG: MFS transporter [Sandaracinaceae bacterium]